MSTMPPPTGSGVIPCADGSTRVVLAAPRPGGDGDARNPTADDDPMVQSVTTSRRARAIQIVHRPRDAEGSRREPRGALLRCDGVEECTDQETLSEADQHVSTIIVGVDGSPTSRRALDWAVNEARVHRARLRVILAWTSPYDWQLQPIFPVDEAKLRDAAQAQLDQALAGADTRDVAVDADLVEGDARHVLVELARDADLLVLGTRGHSRLSEMLIGSVSTYCASHATCPLVLVPPEAQGEDDGRSG
jgi:nucleotide-binding universal stress UspA family protein